MPNNEKNLQKAVALRYKEGDAAPKVVAKGQGFVAEKILEKAANNDIAVHKDAALVEELSKIDVGLSIPPELYEVVAQILVFLTDLDKKHYGKLR